MIRILITTDNHVGYNETDPVRGEDAANTFTEIMELARVHNVDLVLQAGDLFHVNRPSRNSLYTVIKAIRANLLSDQPCELQVLNHGLLDYDPRFDHVNHLDPNINVAIPMFAISGNHDDSGGASMLSPMDILSAAGLINHFGRVQQNDDITVCPVLLQKGDVKLALYGLANVRDERLFRTFRHNKIKFLRPDQDPDGFFNLMAVHQNHTSHTPTNFLPENFLPDFLDMVVWGHEHECLIDPVVNSQQGFKVMQPGSSVATSLSDGEAVPKHVAIINITGPKSYTLEKLFLNTVRPFAIKTVDIANDSGIKPTDSDCKGKVLRWLSGIVEDLIDQAIQQWTDHHSAEDEPPLPLIRLRVDYTGFEVENPTRFSNRFVGRVANTNDVVLYFRKRAEQAPRSKDLGNEEIARQGLHRMAEAAGVDNLKVQALVEEYLNNQQLDMLQQAELNEAIKQFIDKDDKLALKTFVDGSLKEQLQRLMELQITDETTLLREITKRDDVSGLLASASKAKSVSKPSRTTKAKNQPKPPARASKARAPIHSEDEVQVAASDEEYQEDAPDSDSDFEPEPPSRTVSKARAKPKTQPKAKKAPAPRARAKPKPTNSAPKPAEIMSVDLDSDSDGGFG